MTNSSLLSINTEFEGALTEEQRKQCMDPWSFTREEQFYILYMTLVDLCSKYNGQDNMLGNLIRILGLPASQEDRQNAIEAMKTIAWFTSQVDSIPPGPSSAICLAPDDLDTKKFKWGTSVMTAIKNDPILVDIWRIMLEDVRHRSMLSVGLCARAEALFYNTNPSVYNCHLDLAYVDADEAALRLSVIDEIVAEWQPKWFNGEKMPNNVLNNAYAKVSEEKRELVGSFEMRRKEIVSRNQKVTDNKTKEPTKPKVTVKMVNLPGIDVMLRGTQENCGDPKCLVHGTHENITAKLMSFLGM